jgi:hypothetical protein
LVLLSRGVNVEYFLLTDKLSGILWEGVCDLNEAAKRLEVPLSVVQIAFEHGVLKGYWKIADGQLLMHSQSPHAVGAADRPSPIPAHPNAGPPMHRSVSARYPRAEQNADDAAAIRCGG